MTSCIVLFKKTATGRGSRTFCMCGQRRGRFDELVCLFWWQAMFDWAQAGWVTVLGRLPAKNTNDHVLISSLLVGTRSITTPTIQFIGSLSLLLWKADFFLFHYKLLHFEWEE